MKRNIILLILDGFGISKEKYGNAILQASTPTINYLYKNSFVSTLEASGESVGLLPNSAGNSEVGHLNIGAGRIVDQYSYLIHKDILNKTFFTNRKIKEEVSKTKGEIHLMGLVSDGQVHSNMEIIESLIESIDREKIYLDIFSDGRDSGYKSVEEYIKRLGKYKDKVIISSIIGRFYAMDRDNREKRINKAFELLYTHKGSEVKNVFEAIEMSYKKDITDEFIEPFYIKNTPPIKDEDLVIFFNFREDRARELSLKFLNNTNVNLLCMTQYTNDIQNFIYPRIKVENTLGSILEKNNLSQLRIAETEKYAHVTYFFDGGENIVYKREKRDIIPSLKISTYDKKPQMRVFDITKTIISNIENFNFILANFANPDMVGHTGSLSKTIESIEYVDKAIKEILDDLKDNILIITADHGNAEIMLDKKGIINKSHTISKVPFIIYNYKNISVLKNGKLADIAPTILKILDIKKPKDMSGDSLI